MDLTIAEETYLKAIHRLSSQSDKPVNTNAIAEYLLTSAASVTDMVKRLYGKKLVNYQRYNGTRLTAQGNTLATLLVRKHRLWESFLVHTLGMAWDEVHDIAEELEHIHSDLLINRLDDFLGFPKFDPHGEPIPNAQGKYTLRAQTPLTEVRPGQSGIILAVKNSGSQLLKYLNEKGITIGKTFTVISRENYDQSMHLMMDQKDVSLPREVAQQLLVKNV